MAQDFQKNNKNACMKKKEEHKGMSPDNKAPQPNKKDSKKEKAGTGKGAFTEVKNAHASGMGAMGKSKLKQTIEKSSNTKDKNENSGRENEVIY